jgi:hypothetical protein
MIGVVAFLAAGCATSFTGEAHVEGGPSGCRAKCKAWGMDLSGMVAVGEYSDACICRVSGKGTGGDESGAVGAAAVGVISQMREAEEQRHMVMTVR